MLGVTGILTGVSTYFLALTVTHKTVPKKSLLVMVRFVTHFLSNQHHSQAAHPRVLLSSKAVSTCASLSAFPHDALCLIKARRKSVVARHTKLILTELGQDPRSGQV